jgi:hypothetical protein
MKSSQRDVGAAAARLFSAAAPLLFSRHPLSAVASTVRLAMREQAVPTPASTDLGAGRFWYYVAPQAGSDAWAVLFEGQPRSYGYEAQDEALKAACRAAEAMFRRHHTAAGVRVRVGEDWMEAVKFGSPTGRPQ